MENELNQYYLSKLHKELIDIMDEVDRICAVNNLKYYLIGGTLLGAVRHQGFIPWDDDLDIAMPRKDFDNFVSVAQTALLSRYELQWITTNPEYWQVFAKVCRRDTFFKEQGLKNFAPLGIFVDIFPLDESSEYSPKLERRKKWVSFLNSIIWAKNLSPRGINHLFLRIASQLFSTSLLQKTMTKIMMGARKYGETHYANFGSQYKLKKQTMPKEWFGEGVKIIFEGHEYSAPVEYDKVLKSIFGSDYIQLPPKSKRRCHYPEKVIFSDGEEMCFSKPSHIVTIEEQESI